MQYFSTRLKIPMAMSVGIFLYTFSTRFLLTFVFCQKKKENEDNQKMRLNREKSRYFEIYKKGEK